MIVVFPLPGPTSNDVYLDMKTDRQHPFCLSITGKPFFHFKLMMSLTSGLTSLTQ